MALGVRFCLTNFFFQLIYDKILQLIYGKIALISNLQLIPLTDFDVSNHLQYSGMYPSTWSCDKVNNKGCENLWLKSAFAFTMKKTIMVHVLLKIIYNPTHKSV